MNKPKRTSKNEILRDIIIPVCTVIFSGILSWLIAVRTNTHSAVLDSQRETLHKESPVLNKISDIAEESEMIVLGYIQISKVHEVRITTYVSSVDRQVVGQDTSYIDKPVHDTTYYYIPKFIVQKSSFDRVMTDLSYVKANADLLSHATLKEVEGLLFFVESHPIVFASEKTEIADSEWVKPEIYTVFINKVGQINQSYLKRLRKFGLN